MKILILGYGSAGRKHAKILSKLVKNSKIFFLTKQKKCKYPKISNFYKIKLLNPDYVIISKPTSEHEKYLKLIEKNLKGVKVLIEKPAYVKNKKLVLKKNHYFVGYNLRFDPVLKKIKTFIKNKTIWDINIACTSFLPNWRKNIEYNKSSSAKKKYNGGVLYDLSHELNYLIWIFGVLKVNYFSYKKISNLKINTNDSLVVFGKIKSIQVLVNLNFFSKIENRMVTVNGKDFSICGNILDREIKIFNKNTIQTIKYKKDNKSDTYIEMHKEILFNKKKFFVCTFKESLKTLDLIEKIKND